MDKGVLFSSIQTILLLPFLLLITTKQVQATHRIAILHSQTSQEKFWSEQVFSYISLACQDASITAGLPFDLLNEDDLTDATKLVSYDVIIFYSFRFVSSSLAGPIVSALEKAANAGVSFIGAGPFMVWDETSTLISSDDPYRQTTKMFHLGYSSFQESNGEVWYKVKDGSHGSMRGGVENGDTLHVFGNSAYDVYSPVSNVDAVVTAELEFVSSGERFPAVHAITTDTNSRHVHFIDEWTMLKGSRLWTAIRWCIFGEEDVPSVGITRNEGIFFARNDMDWSKYDFYVPVLHTTVLDIITEWKEKYGFVGSFYIVLGNKPEEGKITNWDISGPLYEKYMKLGNEIGTHSYTHPLYTGKLDAEQLKFEFKDAATIIKNELNLPEKLGAAVPGNPEPLFVAETVDPWLKYLAGGSLFDGQSFTPGIGYLTPTSTMPYILLTMSPDFTLLAYQNLGPEKTEEVWMDEFDLQTVGTTKPIVQFLWHDYAPGFMPGFSIEPIIATIKQAAEAGFEFVAGDDLVDRVDAFRRGEITTKRISAEEYLVTLSGEGGYGRFAISAPEGQSIKEVSVEGNEWPAWDGKSVFTREGGQTYTLKLGGDPPRNVSRITRLPMRAKLIDATADDKTIEASFVGDGDISVYVGQSKPVQIYGGSHFKREGSDYTVSFADIKQQNLVITEPLVGNRYPQGVEKAVDIGPGDTKDITLEGSDPDGQTVKYRIVTGPNQGVLSGEPPFLKYTASPWAQGKDSFVFEVSDNILSVHSVVTLDYTTAPKCVELPTSKSFHIVNRKSNKALNVEDKSLIAGANVRQMSESPESNDNWHLELPDSELGTNRYVIIVEHSGQSLHVKDGSLDPAANVVQWPSIRDKRDTWCFEDLNNGYYRILNHKSNLTLDVNGGNLNDGANIEQFPWHGSSNQQWKLVPIEESNCAKLPTWIKYNIVNRKSDGLVTVKDNSVESGANIIQVGGVSNNPNSKWTLDATNIDGNYYSIFSEHSGKVLSVAGDPLGAASNVEQQTENPDDTRDDWCLSEVEDDTNDRFYRIINRKSGYALNVNGGVAYDGGNIEQYPYHGRKFQQWALKATESSLECVELPTNKNVFIVSRQSNKMIGVENASKAAGANVHQIDHGFNQDEDNDIWHFEPSGNTLTKNIYKIVAKHSGMVLSVQDDSLLAPAGSLVQSPSSSEMKSDWCFEERISGFGGMYRITNVNSGMMVDLVGSSLRDGADIVQFPWHGYYNQHWTLTPAP